MESVIWIMDVLVRNDEKYTSCQLAKCKYLRSLQYHKQVYTHGTYVSCPSREISCTLLSNNCSTAIGIEDAILPITRHCLSHIRVVSKLCRSKNTSSRPPMKDLVYYQNTMSNWRISGVNLHGSCFLMK